MRPTDITDSLLEKYLQDLCTPEEKELVEKWYASLQGQQDYLSTLDQETRSKLKEELYVDIQLRTMVTPPPTRLNSAQKRWFTGVAASIIACMIGSYFFLTTNGKTAVDNPIKIEFTENQLLSFVNDNSQMILHTLPDSSTVWMHPDSRIEYPALFDEDSRKVSFSGEGFFDVKKDPLRPFSIVTGEMTIRVLGTSFNVKALTSNKLIQVSVMTGSVEVSAPTISETEQMVVLAPQQHAIFEHQSKLLVVKDIPAPARKEVYEPVNVHFVEQPLNRVLDVLEKKFNINLQLSDPRLAQCVFNGNFENQPLAAILEMLCISLEATYTISDNIILISGTPCE